MNWHALDPSILVPPLLAGLLVLSTHIPLGQQVLSRGIIFIDLAVAQMAGLGVILAAALTDDADGVVVQLAAGVAALMAAVILNWLEHDRTRIQEAKIGVMFVLAATASIIALANHPHGGEHLKELLVGNILWVMAPQLWWMAAVSASVLVLWALLGRHRGGVWFYGLFAVAITASVQLVGVYLVFASLILPALATRNLSGGIRLAWGYAIGALGYGLGLALSTLLDLPTGAVIVWTLAIVASITGFALLRRPPAPG